MDKSQTSTVRVALDAAKMVWDRIRLRWWAGRGAYDARLEDLALPAPGAQG